MCEFSAYVAFTKATNGQTDIKHETERMMMARYMEDETNKENINNQSSNVLRDATCVIPPSGVAGWLSG